MFGHIWGQGRSAELEATSLQCLVWVCLGFWAAGLTQKLTLTCPLEGEADRTNAAHIQVWPTLRDFFLGHEIWRHEALHFFRQALWPFGLAAQAPDARKLRKLDVVRFDLSGKNRDPEKSIFDLKGEVAEAT